MAANSPDSTVTTTPVSESSLGKRVRNLLVVLVAVVLTVALVLGLRTQTTSVSLTELAESSLPIEVALTNKKPTLIEFYANWCTSCQAMAEDVSNLKQQYSDRVNFVMLNVDNTKWLPEILHYRVDGIPHFVFLDRNGEAIAQSIGEQPRLIMAENLDALIAETPLPYVQASGQTSVFKPKAAIAPSASGATDPRSHGSQVVD